jgi:hypothetical protein
MVQIVFVLERDYSPVRYGKLECLDGTAQGDEEDECIRRQAEVFAANYAPKMRCA